MQIGTAEPGEQADVGEALPGCQRLVTGNADGQFAGLQKLLINAQDFGRCRHILNAGDSVFGGVAHGGSDGARNFIFRRRGNDAIDCVHGGIFEDAGGFAVGVADDGAAGRIGRVTCDAGELERDGVGERHVPVEPVDEDRVVARGFVDQLAGWKAGGSPVFVVPVAAENPAALRKRRGKFADALAELRFTFRIAQLNAGDMRAAGVEVDMSIVKSGNGELAAEVDDLSFRSGPLADVGGGPDGDDAGGDARDGLGLRLGGADGPDFAVGEDEVGVGLRGES